MELGALDQYVRDSFPTVLPGRPRGEEFSSVSLTTEQAYMHDWGRFTQWCLAHGSAELPAHPRAVLSFLESEKRAGAGMATLNRRVAAINYMHRNIGMPSPLAHEDAQVIRDLLVRPSGLRPRRTPRKRSVDLWQEVLEAIPQSDRRGLRDRALIALHVSAAFRLLELSRLTIGQVRLDRASAQINLGRFRSHTARGSSAITVIDDAPITPVSQLRIWMEACGALSGPLFRRLAEEGVTDQGLTEDEIAAVMTTRILAAGHQPRRGAGGLIQLREGMGQAV